MVITSEFSCGLRILYSWVYIQHCNALLSRPDFTCLDPAVNLWAPSNRKPVPVAARSKAWVCDRSLDGIAGSNPAGGHGCKSVVSVVCCAGRGLWVGLITCPEESYHVWCVWVWSWILNSEVAQVRVGLFRDEKKTRQLKKCVAQSLLCYFICYKNIILIKYLSSPKYIMHAFRTVK